MARYRLAPLALLVAALVAVVAVVAHGRPLATGAGRGSGLPASFWDYLYSSLMILAAFVVLAGLATVLIVRPPPKRQRFEIRTLRMLASLIVVGSLMVFFGRHLNYSHLLNHQHKPQNPHFSGHLRRQNLRPPHATSGPRFRWDELAVVLGLLVVAGAIFATRSRSDRTRRPQVAAETLAAALDDSLDDLRSDPDLRRAIIAAYARMETALAAAGIPRRPAEAPLEYLERALLSLDTSAEAVRRLTDLFEWARFSHHEPEPSMRDDAVDALIEVRDELRASELTPA